MNEAQKNQYYDRYENSTHLLGRLGTAAAILLLYVTLFFVGGFVISSVESLPLSACLFETASAGGTVGLSLGLTPTLGGLSRAVLIFLMFMGRVGGLTLIYAALSGAAKTGSKLPQERITIG